MQDLGKILATIGALGFLAAIFLMPTAVGDVVNLALLQQQTMAAAGALTLALAGAILTAGGAILDVVRPAALPDADEAAALDALGITRQGKDYVYNGYVYRTAREAMDRARETRAPNA